MANIQRLFGQGILHGGDYNPDQWRHDPRVLEEDIRLMQKCGCNTFSTAIFAWSALEPEEGRYDFEWLDVTIDRLHGAARRVILATPRCACGMLSSCTCPFRSSTNTFSRRFVSSVEI